MRIVLLTLVAVLSMVFTGPLLPPVAATSKDSGEITPDAQHESRAGEKIHVSQLQGHQFEYWLIEYPASFVEQQRNKNKTKKTTAPAPLRTHHLMVYITNAEGKPVTKALVGFLLVNPDGTKQKMMAAAMTDGFGADIDLSSSGPYTFKAKAVQGEQKFLDAFEYGIK